MTKSVITSVKSNRLRRNGKRPYKSNGARMRNWLSRKYGGRYPSCQVWED